MFYQVAIIAGDKKECKDGYEEVTAICIDKCGDGSVKLNPQVWQCDDGNDRNDDGCSKD